MRISTIQAFNNGVNGLQNNYSNATRTQEQISTGKRLLTPADDPVASVRLLQLSQEEGLNSQYKTGITAAKNSLTAEETVLNSVGNVLQRIREIAVSAGNGAQDSTDKAALATELAQREDELMNLLNSRDAGGKYLFSGSKGDTQPFIRNSDGSYTYQGDEGQRNVQIASSTFLAVNDSGKALFENISNSNRVDTVKVAGSSDVRISLGVITDPVAYDKSFPKFSLPADGVTIRFTSDTEYAVFDASGTNPVLSNGVPATGVVKDGAAQYGGVRVGLNATPGAGDSFKLTPESQKHDTVAVSSSAPAGLVGASPTPEKPGVGIKFLSDRDYVVYDLSSPPDNLDTMTLDTVDKAQVLATGRFDDNPQTSNFVEYGGMRVQIDGTPTAGDTFAVSKNVDREKTSLLNTVADLRRMLQSGEDTPEGSRKIRDATAVAIGNLDLVNTQVLSVQGKIGARLNVIDSTESFLTDLNLVNKSVQSELEDLDYVEALSRMAMQTTVLQAAQQSYMKIANLSLFNYL